jgi:hypothetical protein
MCVSAFVDVLPLSIFRPPCRVLGVRSKKPGPKAVDLSILVNAQRKWLSIFRLLQYGFAKGREPHIGWVPPEQPKLYSGDDGRNANLLNRYEERLRDSTRWRQQISEVERKAIAAEPETLDAMFSAKTIQEMRDAWRSSELLRPLLESAIPPRSTIAEYFHDPAPPNPKLVLQAIRKAKNYRFPGADRQTSESKTLVHFASAIAGLESGLSPASAIDRLRKLKHGPKCPCAPCSLGQMDALEKIVRPLIKASKEKIETNPPLGAFYITPPPREIQRRSKRRVPTMTPTGGFLME